MDIPRILWNDGTTERDLAPAIQAVIDNMGGRRYHTTREGDGFVVTDRLTFRLATPLSCPLSEHRANDSASRLERVWHHRIANADLDAAMLDAAIKALG